MIDGAQGGSHPVHEVSDMEVGRTALAPREAYASFEDDAMRYAHELMHNFRLKRHVKYGAIFPCLDAALGAIRRLG